MAYLPWFEHPLVIEKMTLDWVQNCDPMGRYLKSRPYLHGQMLRPTISTYLEIHGIIKQKTNLIRRRVLLHIQLVLGGMKIRAIFLVMKLAFQITPADFPFFLPESLYLEQANGQRAKSDAKVNICTLELVF